MPDRLPVIVQGLGPIGRTILLAAARDARFQIVGAVEIDKRAFGRDLADFVEGAPAGITVRPSLGQARAEAGLEEGIVLHATSSFLPNAAPQFHEALQLGLHVVSTCEELAYPWPRYPDLAGKLDADARRVGRTLVATGVNPGFLMDALPVTLTAASHDIRSIRVERIQDPTPRRVPFQEKVGMGLSRADYDARATSGGFGHVGLQESGLLLALGLGWEIADWAETLGPVQPDPDGPVTGTLQTLAGETADGRRLELVFRASADVPESYDAISIEGTPPLRMRFEGGVFGDDATAAAVLRCARVMRAAPNGLATVLDLPLRA